MKIIDFGLSRYGKILSLQEKLLNELLESKKTGGIEKEFVLIGEHYPVLTLGRRAKEENILVSSITLSQKGIEIFKINRGGDVTYHSPGMLIVYPILDLEKYNLSVKNYVSILEETVIRLIGKYGIKGDRIEGATGVWIGKDTPQERKISALGVKCSRFCTMHGLALNVNCSLEGFKLINPCGFIDKGVTSMKEEIKRGLDMEKIKEEFLHIFFSLILPFQKVLDFPEKLRGENEII